MKQLFLGLTAAFAFGTAFAQTAAPAATTAAAPAAQLQADDQTAAAPSAEAAPGPTTPVVNTAPRVTPAVISAGAAAALLAIAFTAGDGDDRPSSP